MLATVNPSKWSLLVNSYYHNFEESANIVYNEASHLLVNCTLLTNKRTIYLSIYLTPGYFGVIVATYIP